MGYTLVLVRHGESEWNKLNFFTGWTDIDLTENGHREAREAGLSYLPSNLGEAVDLFESSELMKRTLGEHIHSYLVKTKRAEWLDYLSHVSQWELDRYLAVL